MERALSGEPDSLAIVGMTRRLLTPTHLSRHSVDLPVQVQADLVNLFAGFC